MGLQGAGDRSAKRQRMTGESTTTDNGAVGAVARIKRQAEATGRRADRHASEAAIRRCPDPDEVRY
jgi:hypothetical protein